MPVGHPTDYKPEYCEYVVDKMANEGYIVEEFCLDWDISTATFYNWLNVHPAFLDAYTRGQQRRKGYHKRLLERGLSADRFNERAFAMLLRYCGESGDERTIRLPKLAKAKTFAKKCDVILKAFTDEYINSKEANAILDMIGKMAKIDEVTEMRKKLEEIELARKQGR